MLSRNNLLHKKKWTFIGILGTFKDTNYLAKDLSRLFWKSMEVHNVPEDSDDNTCAEKGKSETFSEFHGISFLRAGKRAGKYYSEGSKYQF